MRTRKIKQKGGSKDPFVSHNGIYISGEGFKNVCKYNLDDRYPIIGFDDKLEENDLVFIKQYNINNLLNSPPSKKVRLVVHNTDETFDDSVMDRVRPYTNKVYAVNSSAKDAIQIPLGFRDDQYTPHKVLDEVYKSSGKVKRDILCLLNFSIQGGEDSERAIAHRAFKDYNWVKSDVNNTPGLHLDHKNPKTIELRKDFYTKLTHTKFVICPFGTGKDTHRVYEALFYGAIPIIKTSFLDPMYKKLGGCWIVKEWSEVTEKECNKHWKNKDSRKIHTDVKYWLSKVSYQNNSSSNLKSSEDPLVSVYLMCYNEEKIIGFTVKYYKRQFPGCIITICDNESSDNSVKIAKKLGCNIHTYKTDGVFNETTLMNIRNNIWKGATTKWVIVCDMDEILTANQNDIISEQEKGTTILKTKGYEIYADSKKEDLSNIKANLDKVTTGIHSGIHSKKICFDRTRINEINFGMGSHEADPKGHIKFSEKEYYIYHYKHLGFPYYKFTHQRTQPRAKLAENKGILAGNHYTLDENRLRSNSNISKLKLEKLPELETFYLKSL